MNPTLYQEHMEKKNMGYSDKKGLGIHEQGSTSIIETSKQKGRRGLGFSLTDFADETVKWDFNEDPALVEEQVQWCPFVEETPLQLDDLRQWLKLDQKKRTIDDETQFCDENILRDLLSSKTVFDSLSQQEMEQARERSNAYETIRGAMFMNRAAIKLANIDSVFGWIFSDPQIPNTQKSLVQPSEPFYFVDMCAGPGGFSEYLLWRRNWRSKGFGFTLRGKSDFRLHDFLIGTPETFDPYYGVKDIEGDGDITNPENLDALQSYVHKCTMDAGVHVATADGGFSVEGQENIQEILSKQLYLCQFLTALSVLRPGGNFVCKLFDLFTPFSVGLVYLMYRTFNQIAIHKPVSSRPANSERYIICKGLREDVCHIVRTYMYEINVIQCKHRSDTEQNDVQTIVPLHIIKSNKSFYDYIVASNNRLGEHQIRNLRKIRTFVSNSKLIDPRQSDIRQQCLSLWKIPDNQRPRRRAFFCNALDQGIDNYILNTPNLLKKCVLNQNQIVSLFDYRCVLSLGDPVLLLSCGGRTLRKKSAIYIVDAYFIGDENILMNNERPVVFMERFRLMKLFERAINKPARLDLVPIRISEQLRCEHLDSSIEKLCQSGQYDQIDNEKLWYVNEHVENKPRVQVRGIWFFKFVQHPWTILLSRSRHHKYFYNQNTRIAENEAPSDSSHVACLRSMLENSFYWDFSNRDDIVTKSHMISFIRNKNRDQQQSSSKH
ncbi:unnamed protein product [Didymodactylos carnosus]|uniref:Cap-specific mRNA (nucleoside-2'-O-)-methyltransferase 1 n=1 Tax=Didymodactylos carnosus TaxID=1234261 RepID=A0A814F1H1_9BILA|nr:unnamed protein product [Didymodactylos carnosus]CAF0976718.1 unnamed protein product [Didymodactylos carnosus]CAF3571560.1 unnamed protein product [Didymodactylos carnosus]CAF3749565.1 unnamed protein product [Didymodactylos carnosus]